MRKLTLALAAVGAIGLAATSTPANAGFFTGLKAPETNAGAVEVQRRCYHRRYSSRWRCHRVHSRWQSRHYW